MRVLVFGATGRVGKGVVERAAAAGHEVTAFVRDPRRLTVAGPAITTAKGDIYQAETVRAAMSKGIDAVVVTVGADPLKPSTVVTDTARAVVQAMKEVGIARYLGITGTAEMPDKNLFGRLSTRILRLTPVGNAVKDHDAAFAIVREAGLDWTLAACPYIKDGPSRERYRISTTFTGGFQTIHPGDVAHFLVAQLEDHAYPKQAVGIWY